MSEAAPETAPPAEAAPETQPPQPPAKGYPAGVPVGEMEPEQQAAYWRERAQKWQSRAEGNKVAADRLEQLERERMTDEEKARTEAFEGGRAAERTALTERLVAAEFKAAAALAGRDVNEVAGLLEDLNVSRFLTADGEVDTERITARVSALPSLHRRSLRAAPAGPRAGPA
jgi:hypothetical protein